jgi:hypothetical protein
MLLTNIFRGSVLVGLLLMASVALPHALHAGEVNIVNNVSTAASSGGNSAGAGEVKEGKSSASMKVRTEINGEVVEEYEETREGTGEVEVKYEKTTTQQTGDAEVTTSAQAAVGIVGGAGVDASTTVETVGATSSVDAEVQETNDEAHNPGFVSRLFSRIFSYVWSFF